MAPFVVHYVYFALVLVQFICQLFSDINALKNWSYRVPGNYETLSDKDQEDEPLLDKTQNRADFFSDEVNIPVSKIFLGFKFLLTLLH